MKKTFDCVAMKRAGALQVHERLRGMNAKQRAAYWKKRSVEFDREQEKLVAAGAGKPAKTA